MLGQQENAKQGILANTSDAEESQALAVSKASFTAKAGWTFHAVHDNGDAPSMQVTFSISRHQTSKPRWNSVQFHMGDRDGGFNGGCEMIMPHRPSTTIKFGSPLKVPRKSTNPDAARRQMCDALWRSQCDWLPSDLVTADNELAKVGILTLQALQFSLSGNFRDKLGGNKQSNKAFKTGAVRALKHYLGGNVLPGCCCDEGAGPTDFCPKPQKRRELCNELWRMHSTWTPTALFEAEQRLLRTGESLETLINDLSTSTMIQDGPVSGCTWQYGSSLLDAKLGPYVN